MPDTARNITDLKTLLADNTAGNISAQDIRDFLVSCVNIVETSLQTLQSPLTVTGTVTGTTFAGSGASLTNVPAASLTGSVADARLTTTALPAGNLTGSIADARLSANVPLKNAANTFSANQTVTGTVTATTFAGSGASLTALPAASLTGNINDLRLSANIPRKDVANTFYNTITAPAFAGENAYLTGEVSCTNIHAAEDNFTVDGDGNMAVNNIETNNVTVAADMSVGGSTGVQLLQVGSDLTVTGVATLNGNLVVNGQSTISGGTINLPSLPGSDPGIPGQLWHDESGFVKIAFGA